MKNFSGKNILWVVLGLFIAAIIWAVLGYNSLVGLRETVDKQTSNIETQLQRRADLIPNLVNTVKGYTSHESEILSTLSEARSKLAGSGNLSDKMTANSEISDAVSRLLVVVENYPDLKADKQFTALMDELSGTENRITVARNDYNVAVQSYNQSIKRFPSNIIAGMFGFDSAEYFEASEASKSVPNVSFS